MRNIKYDIQEHDQIIRITEHEDTLLIRLLRYCTNHLLFYDAAVTPYVGCY